MQQHPMVTYDAGEQEATGEKALVWSLEKSAVSRNDAILQICYTWQRCSNRLLSSVPGTSENKDHTHKGLGKSGTAIARTIPVNSLQRSMHAGQRLQKPSLGRNVGSRHSQPNPRVTCELPAKPKTLQMSVARTQLSACTNIELLETQKQLAADSAKDL